MQVGQGQTRAFIHPFNDALHIQQKIQLNQMLNDTIQICISLVYQDFLDFFGQHIQNKDNGLQVVMVASTLQSIEKIAAGHFHQHLVDLVQVHFSQFIHDRFSVFNEMFTFLNPLVYLVIL